MTMPGVQRQRHSLVSTNVLGVSITEGPSSWVVPEVENGAPNTEALSEFLQEFCLIYIEARVSGVDGEGGRF